MAEQVRPWGSGGLLGGGSEGDAEMPKMSDMNGEDEVSAVIAYSWLSLSSMQLDQRF